MKNTLLISILFVALCSTAFSQTMVTVEGSGHSRSESVNKALVEALRQVNGVFLESKNSFESSFKSIETDLTSEATAESKSNRDIRSISKGYISSYKVIDSALSTAGIHECVIEAWVRVFDPTNPRPGMRPTLAILEFKPIDEPAIKGVDSAVLVSAIGSKLVANIDELGMFTIVEREFLAAIVAEAKFTASSIVNPSECSKIGQLLGADYVLVGNIQNASFSTERTKQLGGNVYDVESVSFSSNMRIVDVASGTILAASQPSELNLSGNDLTYHKDKKKAPNIESFFATVAAKEFSEFMEKSLAPKIVLAVSKTSGLVKEWQFKIEDAGNSLQVGQEFEVFVRTEGTRSHYANIKISSLDKGFCYGELLQIKGFTPEQLDESCQAMEKHIAAYSDDSVFLKRK